MPRLEVKRVRRELAAVVYLRGTVLSTGCLAYISLTVHFILSVNPTGC